MKIEYENNGRFKPDIEMVVCHCGHNFARRTSKRSGVLPKNVRAYRSVNCSTKCSSEWGSVRAKLKYAEDKKKQETKSDIKCMAVSYLGAFLLMFGVYKGWLI